MAGRTRRLDQGNVRVVLGGVYVELVWEIADARAVKVVVEVGREEGVRIGIKNGRDALRRV